MPDFTCAGYVYGMQKWRVQCVLQFLGIFLRQPNTSDVICLCLCLAGKHWKTRDLTIALCVFKYTRKLLDISSAIILPLILYGRSHDLANT